MQPSPSADTVGPSRPSVRSFMGALCTHAASWSDARMDYGLRGQGRARDRCGIGHRPRDGGAVRARWGRGSWPATSTRTPARRWPRRCARAAPRRASWPPTSPTARRCAAWWPTRSRRSGGWTARRTAPASAGGTPRTHEYPEAEWDRIVEINLRGTWLAMRAEIEAMLTGGGGAIVNVSSTLGLRGSPFAAPYSASKHAVLGLTRTAALEYAAQGIRVNAVCPGAIDTPMMDATFERFPGFRETLTSYVPMGRMGGPGEVAGAIAWLSSDAASFVTGRGADRRGRAAVAVSACSAHDPQVEAAGSSRRRPPGRTSPPGARTGSRRGTRARRLPKWHPCTGSARDRPGSRRRRGRGRTRAADCPVRQLASVAESELSEVRRGRLSEGVEAATRPRTSCPAS